METWFPFPHSIAGDCDQVIVVVGELEVSGCRRGLPDPADHRKQLAVGGISAKPKHDVVVIVGVLKPHTTS